MKLSRNLPMDKKKQQFPLKCFLFKETLCNPSLAFFAYLSLTSTSAKENTVLFRLRPSFSNLFTLFFIESLIRKIFSIYRLWLYIKSVTPTRKDRPWHRNQQSFTGSALHGAFWYTPAFLCYARFFCHFAQNPLNQKEAVVDAYSKICQLETYFISMEGAGHRKLI